MKIVSPKEKLVIIDHELGANTQFKLYQCQVADDTVCILKIARKKSFNGLLDREAFILDKMKTEAFELEKELQEKEKTDKFLNYHYFFPQLLETFISPEQENSRISLLSFSHVAKGLNKLSPLSHLVTKENVRIDPRSSAWILGKLLKLLSFVHDQGIAVGNLTGENILINREQHYVMIADWSQAITSAILPATTTRREIAQVAIETILALNGNPKNGKLPLSEQLSDTRYERFIRDLATESHECDAFTAHNKFYKLIRSIWPSKFHPFTTYPL